MKRLVNIFYITTFLLLCQHAQAVELKLATIAPQGTTLYSELEDAAKEIQTKTNGKVTVKIFGGGVLGEDKELVGKMRFGEIDGAALTGVGLGMIEPEIRSLELPFLFETFEQVDKVYTALEPYFTQKFNDKGFQLLGWSEVGFIKIFSNKAIREKKDLSGMKMWMWEGDMLAQTMYEAMGVTPVPLSIADVLHSLQTNTIDAAYSPELAALGFQWQTATKYMTDVNLTNGTGGIILTNKAWAKLASDEKSVVKSVISSHAHALIAKTRSENQASKLALQNNGIEIVTVTPSAMTELKNIGLEVRQKLVGKLYSQDVLDKITSALK